jgi:hypothetical protein
MKCSNCGSDRILSVSAKCSDLGYARFGNMEHNGYLPYIEGTDIGGDYASLDICMQCGMSQGEFPISDAVVKEGFVDAGWESEEDKERERAERKAAKEAAKAEKEAMKQLVKQTKAALKTAAKGAKK